MAYLELQHIDKHFAGVAAVRDFNLAVERGEFVSLLGPSGCGKTTTLRMIAGFEQPDAGEIRLDGTDLTRLPPEKRGMGMVFQGYALFPNLSVADNVAFGLDVARQPQAEIQERVRRMLELVRLPEMARRYPYQLSGGQQQRVALARALAIRPSVLLLDEPLSALDAVVRVALREEIRRIQLELGITTVYVTHDQEEALSMSDRVVVMKEGRIEQIGKPDEIYRRPSTLFVAAFIGTANQLRGVGVDAGQVRFHDSLLRLPRGAYNGSVEVVLLLRPESIHLSTQPPAGNGQNVLPGSVQALTFLGSVIRVATEVFGERIVVDVSAGEELSLTHGQHVWLSFSPEACQVMEKSEDDLLERS